MRDVKYTLVPLTNFLVRIPEDKKQKFKDLGQEILSLRHGVPFNFIEKFRGKCCAFLYVIPHSLLFIREITALLKHCEKRLTYLVDLSKWPDAEKEILFWMQNPKFLDREG